MRKEDQQQIRRLMKSTDSNGFESNWEGEFAILGKIPFKTPVTKKFMKQIKDRRQSGIYIQQR